MYNLSAHKQAVPEWCVWPREIPPGQRAAKEVALISRLQAGEEKAFREVVDTYAAKVYRACYGILHNRDDADEIAQDVFAKVYISIQRFAGRSSLYSWIYRIAVNECYSFLRKKRIRLVYSSDSPDEPLALRLEAVADHLPTPDQTAVHRDFINKLMAHIPEEQRWLIIAKEVEGYSLGELAAITGLNENAIKVRLYRVRQSLLAEAARLRSRHPDCSGPARTA